jgi:hypothetical protein
MLLKHLGDKLGAGSICGVVEFLSTFVGPELSFILAAEECALVMIEPPIQARITGILKVDDRVFVSIELNVPKKMAGAMGQSLIYKFAVFVDCVLIEVAENGRGRQTIEAIVVKVYLHLPHTVLDPTLSSKKAVIRQPGSKKN